MKNNLEWRNEEGHLPNFLKDFDDQRDIFKAIQACFENSEDCPINLEEAHVYTIDWFLWFMAIHGYTLQKTRAKVEQKDIKEALKAGSSYRL